jgi:predicted signal transduction protein with EAL and GGDEF domain
LAKELLQCADKAMYDAKKSGRGKISYHFWVEQYSKSENLIVIWVPA